MADCYSHYVTGSFNSSLPYIDFLFLLLLTDSRAGEGAPRTVDHAVIGGVVAVVVFAMLCLLIVLGRYFARHKGRRREHKTLKREIQFVPWLIRFNNIMCIGL